MRFTSIYVNAKTAPKRFLAKFNDIATGELREKCNRMRALTSPTPNEIFDIVGHDGFVTTKCNECGKVDLPVVNFKCAHTSTTDMWICIECVESAFNTLKTVSMAD